MAETDPRGSKRPAAEREYPARPIVGVGGVVLFRDAGTSTPPAVLLIRRRFEPLAGRWSLPGGALEVGETLQEGLARELREETGLVVEVGPAVDVFDRITRDEDGRVRYHYVLVDFLCRPAGGRLEAGSDVSEVALVAPADLDRYALTAKTQDVIRRALALDEATGPPA